MRSRRALRRPRAPEHVERDVLRDGQHPGAQVLAVLEPAVRTKCAEKRLLEGIVGAVDAEPPAKEAQYVVPMLLVEALEWGYRHGCHHPRQTSRAADL